jgi:hypothetical protein
VTIDQDIAWRLFTKGITLQAARSHILIAGNQSIGGKITEMVSIMA